MRPFACRAALAAALLLALAGCDRAGAPSRAASTPASDATLPAGLAAGESLDAFDSTFTDQSGERLTLARFHGRPVLLAMVYTRCTSACPLLLANLRRVEASLPGKTREDTWFVLVTLDPDHDSPDTLAAFARARGLDESRWRLLRGSREATTDLAAVLGVKVREEAEGAIAHSSNVYLIDAAGVVRHVLVGLDADPRELVAARRALPS